MDNQTAFIFGLTTGIVISIVILLYYAWRSIE